jgi:tRNA-Thr(GGU) m(6)t(6)A37 methyltransferase TsaA
MSGPVPGPPGTPLPRYDLPADAAFALRPIGVVRSPWKLRTEAPRQGTVDPAARACIVLRPGLHNALKDLAGFDRLWILAWFHWSRGWNQQLVPPRDTVKRGVFATRSPDRPNALGLTCATIVRVHGGRIWIRGHDLLDGTPVLDLKPYIADYDAFPQAARGWLDGLSAPGPDHRRPAPPPDRPAPRG